MSTLYATGLGMGPGALVAAILFSQAVGVPATLLFGKVATRVGPKRALMATLVVYACVSFLAYFMRTAVHFGSSRAALLSMLLFFVAGAAVLSRVDVEAGIRAARDAEARAVRH
jgi:MFS-type transporter involved in bile tolerance (Atg22 family)